MSVLKTPPQLLQEVDAAAPPSVLPAKGSPGQEASRQHPLTPNFETFSLLDTPTPVSIGKSIPCPEGQESTQKLTGERVQVERFPPAPTLAPKEQRQEILPNEKYRGAGLEQTWPGRPGDRGSSLLARPQEARLETSRLENSLDPRFPREDAPPPGAA